MELAAEFPILNELIYFNHAGVAPLPACAAQALSRFAEEAARLGATVWPRWNQAVAGSRAHAAALLNVRPEEIAFIHNTTHGLLLVAQSLRWRPGDCVLGLADDFPANVYPWTELATRGVTRHTVAPRIDGRYHIDDFAAALTPRTRVVAVSLVHYATGFRLPIEPLAEICHARGVLLCVDGIQGLGALPVDVPALGCDFLVADSHKWLLGLEGLGLLYIRHELLDQLDTALTGWVGRVRRSDYDDLHQPLVHEARRYEEGSHNIAGFQALQASLGLLREITLPVVWHRIEALTHQLSEGVKSLGYTVLSPRDTGERSGILSITRPGFDAAQAVKHMAARGVHVAVRGAGLRFSPHFYNTPEQCERCLAVLAEYPAEPGP